MFQPFMNTNYTFLLSLAVIAIGYLFKMIGILNAKHGKSLATIIINVTLPALILKTLSTIALDFSLVLMPLICVAFNVVIAGLAFLLFRKRINQERGVAMLCSTGFNIGLFAYPLIEALFHQAGLKQIAMFDLGNAFIVFGLSYLLGYQYSAKNQSGKFSLKKAALLLLKSVPFMSYILAITLNLTRIAIPKPALDVLAILAQANMGMALLVLGLTLNFQFDKSHWRLILSIVGLRYACGLVVGAILLWLLPYPITYKIILLFALNLPVGLSSIPFAAELGYDECIAGTVANITIIISFVFMWSVLLGFPGSG